jgi:hypothetical protein
MARTRGALFVCLLLLSAFVSSARALAQFHLPGLPGLPHLPSAQRLAIDAASKRLAPYVQNNAPVRLDWSSVYPTLSQPPGGAFLPQAGHAGGAFSQMVARQLARSPNGIVALAPGDYALPIRVYCTDIHRHAHQPENYLVGPLRGARANVLTALYSKVGAARAPYHTVQVLSWSLQAGTRYGSLADDTQALFNRLIPNMRGQISGSFIDQMREQWSRYSIAGLPSFDSALGQMDGLGQTIQSYQNAQSSILANASNFDALSASLAPQDRTGGRTMQSVPWSQVAPNIYMRSPSTGDFGSIGEMDIRVTGTPGQMVPVPIESQILYPPGCPNCQPLTYNPEPVQPSSEDGGGDIPG